MAQGRGTGGSKNTAAEKGTPDLAYNLISVIYHALQGAETYGMYASDAAEAENKELARFFRDTQRDNIKRADRAKELLKGLL